MYIVYIAQNKESKWATVRNPLLRHDRSSYGVQAMMSIAVLGVVA